MPAMPKERRTTRGLEVGDDVEVWHEGQWVPGRVRYVFEDGRSFEHSQLGEIGLPWPVRKVGI